MNELKKGDTYKTIRRNYWGDNPERVDVVTITRVGAHSVWWKVGNGGEESCRLKSTHKMPPRARPEDVARVEQQQEAARLLSRIVEAAKTASLDKLRAALEALQ